MIITRSRLLPILTVAILVIVFLGQAEAGGGTPTPTPNPGIFESPDAPPSEVILPVVEDVMRIDEDCLLPCFWGFHLGINTTEETTDFVIDKFQQIPYISIDSEIENNDNLLDPSTREMDFYETFLPLSSEGGSLQSLASKGGSLQVDFRSIDDVLVRIDVKLFRAVNWLEDNPFLLSELLSMYGEPTHIYFRYSGTPTIGYVLAVVYEDLGFIVEYRSGGTISESERLMNERITEEGRLLICDEDPAFDSIELTLQSDDSPLSLLEALLPPFDDPSVYRPFWGIEDMTGLSIEEFTEIFAGNPEACIEAFSLSELREQGYN